MTEPVPPARIRNVALVGHTGAGKTTLAEALLHHAGATDRLGRVDDGTAVTDHEPEEIARRTSLSLALASFELACPSPSGRSVAHKVNLLDCPGDADFVGDVHAALRVADLAVVVVSAVDGVQVQTEEAWRIAADLGLPRMLFINKLDRERASFERTLDQLRDRLGAGIAPLELPIGEEAGLRGIADLLTDTAHLYEGGSVRLGPVPDDMEAREHTVHDTLVEGIVVADDDLCERYLDGDVPTTEELEATLARGLAEASVFPVVCGSAARGVGIDRLATLLCEIGPSPLDRPPAVVVAGDAVVEVAPDPDGPPLAFVFRTVADPYVGSITLFKVLSGTVRPDEGLVNPRTGQSERLHSLFGMRGRDHLEVAAVPAGDIAAVAKLVGVRAGDTLAPRAMPVRVDPLEVPAPTLSIAVRPRTTADDDRLAVALARLVDEDLALTVRRDPETRQTVVSGAGDTHLAVTLERLRRKYGVDVEVDDVRVAYRETATAAATAEGRHKKQSGGHGQFAVVVLRVEPLERGAGLEFVDAVVGGAIPRQFLPAVAKGVEEAMASGGASGHPVVDVRVTCLDGRAHSVDSSEMAFKLAAGVAFRAALADAAPVVLEPVSSVEVDVPGELLGDVLGDLSARRGRVLSSTSDGSGRAVVAAAVPTAELARYAVDLRSLTGGRGRFAARHESHAPVPSTLVPAGG